MSYTYTPGARPDALAILRDKGLLDTPVRPRHTPGVFLLDLHDHCRIGADGLPRRVAAPVVNRAVPVTPALDPWRAVGWVGVAVVICGFLLMLLAVGA